MKKIFYFIVLGYIILGFLIFQIPDSQFHIYFFNIGQGDSIFIKTPQNNQILIDGGPQNTVIQELGKVMPFFDRSIDFIVLTHPHDDHVAGLVEVLKRYEVGAILITGVEFKNPYYDEFLKEIYAQKIPLYIARADEDFRFGSVYLDILYPFSSIEGTHFSNLNNSSIVAKLIYKTHKILLTGDLEKEGEYKLLDAGVDLSADVLKVGHHGSKTSSTERFLRKVKAKIAVIQCGENNKFGHPHAISIRNLYRSGIEKIFRNDIDGQVEFTY